MRPYQSRANKIFVTLLSTIIVPIWGDARLMAAHKTSAVTSTVQQIYTLTPSELKF